MKKKKKIKSNFPKPLLVLVLALVVIFIFNLEQQNDARDREIMKLKRQIDDIESENLLNSFKSKRNSCGPFNISIFCD